MIRILMTILWPLLFSLLSHLPHSSYSSRRRRPCRGGGSWLWRRTTKSRATAMQVMGRRRRRHARRRSDPPTSRRRTSTTTYGTMSASTTLRPPSSSSPASDRDSVSDAAGTDLCFLPPLFSLLHASPLLAAAYDAIPNLVSLYCSNLCRHVTNFCQLKV